MSLKGMEIIEPFAQGCFLYIKNMCNKEELEQLRSCLNTIKISILMSEETIVPMEIFYYISEMLHSPVYNLHNKYYDNCYLLTPTNNSLNKSIEI